MQNDNLVGNNKGLMFSTATLVSIIVGIILLAFGIQLVFKIVGRSQEELFKVDEQIQQRIAQLFAETGDNVVVPLVSQTASPGSSVKFYVGILNNEANRDVFILNVTENKYYPDQNTEQPFPINFDIEYYKRTELDPNDNQIRIVFIKIPKNAGYGQYTFNVNVSNNVGKTYGFQILVLNVIQ